MTSSRLTIGRSTTLCMSLSGRPGSFGSRFHNHLYQALALDYLYKAFSTHDLASAIAGVRALGIRGCSVSMPFKEACIPLLDDLGPTARAISSVNTIVNDAGRLTGHNTDYAAVLTLLRELELSSDTRVALRGSGGMAKAVAHALREAGFENVLILARNVAEGTALAQALSYEQRTELAANDRPALLINATPIGMSGGPESDALPFEAATIAQCQVAFEVVAIPEETPFVRAARDNKKRVVTGGRVLVLQGLDQFVLYTGQRPNEQQLSAAAAYALTG
jgi:shikimate dehydrogenase